MPIRKHTNAAEAARFRVAAVFDAPGTDREPRRLETRTTAADFQSDLDRAQEVLLRRRRLQADRDLAESLQRKTADLGVPVDRIGQGEPVEDDLAASLDAPPATVEAGEIKKMLGGEETVHVDAPSDTTTIGRARRSGGSTRMTGVIMAAPAPAESAPARTERPM